MSSLTYQKKFASEKRKAYFATVVLDSFLIFYFFFMIYFFSLTWKEDSTYATQNLDIHFLSILGGVATAIAIVWGWWGRSPGVSLVYRTNKYLKGSLRDEVKKVWWQKPYAVFSVIVFLSTFVLGFIITEVSFRSLFSEGGLAGAQRIFLALLSPNWSIISAVLSKMLETIFIAFIATAMAIPFAFFASFFCARNMTQHSVLGKFLYVFLRTLFNFTRSVEPVIWAIIFAVWVGIGPFAGMLALMVNSISLLSKLYSEFIENADNGPIEAMEATGASRLLVIWHAVVPQILTPFISYTIYRWDTNIRMATVVGLVGGGGIGTLLYQYQGLAKWNEVGTIVVVITAVLWVMDFLSSKFRQALL